MTTDNVGQSNDEASDQQSELETPESEAHTEEVTQSLEQVSFKDGTKFLDALKQQDTQLLSALMAHAENEYTEKDMATVIEGFQLYFDDLAGLQLQFETNQQNEEYYIENYHITGTKDGEERILPFQLSYAKSQGVELILDEDKHEVLYNSPLIGLYPYAVSEVERYVQALQVQDKESLALHLGMYDDNEQTKAAIDQMLQTYNESLSLSSVEIVSKGYSVTEELVLFELHDNNGQMHELRIVGEERFVLDDWVDR